MQSGQLKRREFITLLGGAVALPLAAHAQHGGVRKVGVLMTQAADDTETVARLTSFSAELERLGWVNGRNLQLEIRTAAGDAAARRRFAAELAALAPDAIFATGSGATGSLLDVTRTVPIVFAFAPDPVGAGFVDSLARPGGNVTGFTSFEYGLSGKWLELLKEIAPRATRVAVLRDSAVTAGIGQWGAIQSVAPSLGVEVSPVNVRDAAEIERAVTAFARSSSSGGMIVTGSALAIVHRELIVALTTKHRLPTVYADRIFVAAGGLMSYGANGLDLVKRAAGYVDRILKGEKAADLPVQAPVKYELVINLKTAKALGLTVPDTLLARADEVME
jgi:putative ABC transport system substrate-binding protein